MIGIENAHVKIWRAIKVEVVGEALIPSFKAVGLKVEAGLTAVVAEAGLKEGAGVVVEEVMAGVATKNHFESNDIIDEFNNFWLRIKLSLA